MSSRRPRARPAVGEPRLSPSPAPRARARCRGGRAPGARPRARARSARAARAAPAAPPAAADRSPRRPRAALQAPPLRGSTRSQSSSNRCSLCVVPCPSPRSSRARPTAKHAGLSNASDFASSVPNCCSGGPGSLRAAKAMHGNQRYVKLENPEAAFAVQRPFSSSSRTLPGVPACVARLPVRTRCRRPRLVPGADRGHAGHAMEAYPQAARRAVEMLIIENPQSASFSLQGRLHVECRAPRFTSAPSAARK